jgi:hypothetical protein
MANTVRISKDPQEFDDYMNLTDNLQKSDDPITSQKKYLGWGWKDAESTQWTAFRDQSNLLFAIYKDPDKTGNAARIKMNDHIKTVRKYDNDKKVGHHLLDKVALNGTVDDCLTFNVVRGTTLEADPVHHDYDPTQYVPIVSLKANKMGMHLIGVSCADTPDSRSLPVGMKYAKIYRYIGKTAPEKLTDFEFVGNAKYAEFTSDFGDLVIPEGEKWDAYYFARYESENGKLGNSGPSINAPIMLTKI